MHVRILLSDIYLFAFEKFPIKIQHLNITVQEMIGTMKAIEKYVLAFAFS